MKEHHLTQIMHDKALRLINTSAFTRTELSKKLDMTRTTLNTRLEKKNWKVGELYILMAI